MKTKKEKKALFNKWSCLMILVMAANFFVACSEENDIPMDDDGDEFVESEPTTDIVNTTLANKICILGADANYPVLSYLTKRFSNIATSLNEETEIILISESEAGKLIEDETTYELLESLWWEDKTIAFIQPSENSLHLYSKLNGQEGYEYPQEVLEQYKNLSVFAMKASGKRFMHEKHQSQYTYHVESNGTDEDGNSISTNEEKTFEFTPNDYHWGQMAENICTWIKENIKQESKGHNAFQSRDLNSIANYEITTYRFAAKVIYDSYKTDPSEVTVYPKIVISAAAGYSEENDMDIYDIQIEELFPADSTFISNKVTGKKAAYKYKYTGGFYEGLEVSLSLSAGGKEINSETLGIFGPVPFQKAGEVSLTHYPENWTFSGTIGGSLGYKQVGASGAFTFECTTATTTVTSVSSEMPVTYKERNDGPYWSYELNCNYDDIYTGKWGLNGTYHGDKIPSIAKETNITEQAVSLTISNPKSLGNTIIKLDSDINFKCHGTSNSPFNEFNHTHTMKWEGVTHMPQVCRFFEKYTPYPYSTETSADSGYWSNLESILMSNVNYKNFKNENLSIGSPTENGVATVAQKIWEDTIDSLIKQYNKKQKPTYTYIVALADSKGNTLSTGLEINKDGTWKKVTLKK